MTNVFFRKSKGFAEDIERLWANFHNGENFHDALEKHETMLRTIQPSSAYFFVPRTVNIEIVSRRY